MVCVRQRHWASLAGEEVYSVVYQSAMEAKFLSLTVIPGDPT